MRKFPKLRTLTGDKKLKKIFDEHTYPIPFLQPILTPRTISNSKNIVESQRSCEKSMESQKIAWNRRESEKMHGVTGSRKKIQGVAGSRHGVGEWEATSLWQSSLLSVAKYAVGIDTSNKVWGGLVISIPNHFIRALSLANHLVRRCIAV